MTAGVSSCETMGRRKKQRKKERNKATTLIQKYISFRFIGVGGEFEELVARCARLAGREVEQISFLEWPGE